MKAIREAAAAIKICREEAYAVLGIKPEDAADDNLPELKIEGLTQEQVLELSQEDYDQGIDAISALEPLGQDQ